MVLSKFNLYTTETLTNKLIIGLSILKVFTHFRDIVLYSILLSTFPCSLFHWK
jgi:hypothetical protein